LRGEDETNCVEEGKKDLGKALENLDIWEEQAALFKAFAKTRSCIV